VNLLMREERFLKIIDYLKENQTAKLADLAELNNVSLDTVRRALQQLDSKGVLKRVRGGATFLKDDLGTSQAFNRQEAENGFEKKELIELVGGLVTDGQAIALNSGEINIEVARYLVNNYLHLTVLTNSLKIIEILRKARHFTVIVSGGVVDTAEGAIFGNSCVRDISKYNIDLAILDVDAISIEKGITEASLNRSDVIFAMVQSSKKRAVIAERKSFNKVSYVNVCSLSYIDFILTDSRLPKELRAQLEEKDIRVITPHHNI